MAVAVADVVLDTDLGVVGRDVPGAVEQRTGLGQPSRPRSAASLYNVRSRARPSTPTSNSARVGTVGSIRGLPSSARPGLELDDEAAPGAAGLEPAVGLGRPGRPGTWPRPAAVTAPVLGLLAELVELGLLLGVVAHRTPVDRDAPLGLALEAAARRPRRRRRGSPASRARRAGPSRRPARRRRRARPRGCGRPRRRPGARPRRRRASATSASSAGAASAIDPEPVGLAQLHHVAAVGARRPGDGQRLRRAGRPSRSRARRAVRPFMGSVDASTSLAPAGARGHRVGRHHELLAVGPPWEPRGHHDGHHVVAHRRGRSRRRARSRRARRRRPCPARTAADRARCCAGPGRRCEVTCRWGSRWRRGPGCAPRPARRAGRAPRRPSGPRAPRTR